MEKDIDKLQEAVDAIEKYGSISNAAKEMGIPRKTLSSRYNKAVDKGYEAGAPTLTPDQKIIIDDKVRKLNKQKRDAEQKYNQLLKRVNQQDQVIQKLQMFDQQIADASFQKIKKIQQKTNSESTAVLLCSDLHYAEVVEPDKVNFLNEYNTEIARKRFNKLFQNGLKIIEMCRSKSNIKKLVLWLGGDLINGYIHPEFIENNEMSPINECIDVFSMCVSAIDFLVHEGNFEEIIVVTSIGNHGRTTQKMNIDTASENSYEWLIYNFLAKHYEKSDIVKFNLSRGYFNWLNIYGYDLRFHHGHAIRYNGGVSGVGLPLMKAINMWNDGKQAYLDIVGHYHQALLGKRYIMNSSIIGYNSYAQSIKAQFEKPSQTLFLMHPIYGRTVYCPIILES